MKPFPLILVLLFPVLLTAQKLSVEQMIRYPLSSPELIEGELTKLGWKRNAIQVVSDSNFVRRTWEILNSDTKIKCYFLHYEFTNDTAENYTIYQFSNRSEFNDYRKNIKQFGYKQLKKRKNEKKMAASEENIRKEREDRFLNEKTGSYIVIKEVFYLGLFSFLVQSYRPGSAISDHEMEAKLK